MTNLLTTLWMAMLFVLTPSLGYAQGSLKPYVLASEGPGTIDEIAASTEEKLSSAGFRIVGRFAPVDGTKVLAITSSTLERAAGSSEYGGYGAVQRVSISPSGDKVQVAFTNPPYLGHLYRLNQSLDGVRTELTTALGFEREFGSKKGKTPDELRSYHYMMAMPYFDDMFVVATHPDHATALAAVRAALKANESSTTKVYEVAIPGKDEVVFGVAQWAGKGADSVVLKNCDTGTDRMIAYAPYELLVSGNEVRTLHGRFRIALAFPDLSMGTFMRIVGAPPAIKATMEELADGA